jgi:hypothetical protein
MTQHLGVMVMKSEESKSRRPQRKGRTRRIVPAGRTITETEQSVEEKRNESVEEISSEERI